MCGRYYRRSDKQRIADAFKVGVPPSFEILPDYNAAPTTFQPVIVEDRDSGEREIRAMYWGADSLLGGGSEKAGCEHDQREGGEPDEEADLAGAFGAAAVPGSGGWIL
jgi:hypothetical protein